MILMSSQKGIVVNVLIFAAIIIGYIGVTFLTTQPEAKTLSFESSSLQVALNPLNGDSSKAITLKQFRGQSILINFWASWCQACDAEQDNLAKLAQTYNGTSIKMIGIASSDTREAIEKSGKLKNISYPQFVDETGNLALALDVKTLPQTLLVDPQGRIASHFKSPINADQMATLEKQMATLSGASDALRKIPEFALESSFGQHISNITLEKKVWVANIMFTSCPSLCPMLTTKMHTLQEEFKKDDRFKLVSISVDPKTDTQQVLRDYQKKHDADPSRWYFLTGKMEAIKNLLVAGFKLGTSEKPEFHSSRFVLVDRFNRIRGYYDAESSESFERLKSDIAHLLK